MRKLNVAVLGFGTIGKGVVQILQERNDVNIVKIFDHKEHFDLNYKDLFTDDIDSIINDENINLVVEVLGGYNFAKNAIIKCLDHKKHVVTANKEVISKDIDILIDIARINNVSLMYEASVGGGIPIIKNIKRIKTVSKISKITGILNGTTNFIISKMFKGMTYDDALKLAKDKGFAEADPTNDVLGYDMARKIAILSDIAYSTYIDVSKINIRPMISLSKEDIEKAKTENKIIKYVCESTIENDHINIEVGLKEYPNNHVFNSVNDEFNAILLETYPNDTLVFIGKGAGSLPTASAIVSDIVDIMNNKQIQNYKLENKYKIN